MTVTVVIADDNSRDYCACDAHADHRDWHIEYANFVCCDRNRHVWPQAAPNLTPLTLACS